MNIKSRTVQVNHLRTHYLSAGPPAGPGQDITLVLLHGGGESAWAWRWVMPRLAERFRVLAPDLPGSGKSDLVAGRYVAGWYGSFVADFLDALQIERAVVIGHSLGGLAALQMALNDRGERVRGLALVSSAGLGRELNPALTLMTLPGLGEWSTLWRSRHLASFSAWYGAPADASPIRNRFRRSGIWISSGSACVPGCSRTSSQCPGP